MFFVQVLVVRATLCTGTVRGFLMALLCGVRYLVNLYSQDIEPMPVNGLGTCIESFVGPFGFPEAMP